MFPKKHINLNLPKLQKINEVTVNHPEKPFKSNLFALEWGSTEFKKYTDFEKLLRNWGSEDSNEISNKFPGVTSSINYHFTEGMKFVINNDYLNQIRYHSLQSYNDLVNVGIGDTMIREYCMEPSQMHIQVAFFLLADCLFDEKTQYFDRKYKLKLVTSSLLWRYWSFNTGRGLLRKRCLIDELEYENELFKERNDYQLTYDYIKDFDNWLEELNNSYDFIKIEEDKEEEEKL